MSVPREGSSSVLVVVVLHAVTRNKKFMSIRGTCIIVEKDANTFLVTNLKLSTLASAY